MWNAVNLDQSALMVLGINQFSYAATVRDGSPGNGNPEALKKDDDWTTVSNRRNRRSSRGNPYTSMTSNLTNPPRNNSRNSRGRKTIRRHISGKRDGCRLQNCTKDPDFLDGCGLDAQESIIMDYCKKYGVEPLKCEQLQTKSEHHKCYKISVNADDRPTLLDADFWPKGSFVNKFHKTRSS